MEYARATWDDLERLRLYAAARGVETARLVYEDLDADHGLFKNVSAFLLGAMDAEERAACARASVPEPDQGGVGAKIHTLPVDQQIANWAEVTSTLDKTPFRRCADLRALAQDADAPPADILDPASSLSSDRSHPCWAAPRAPGRRAARRPRAV